MIMAGIRIDALPTTVLPSKEHVFPAMKDGLSVQLTLEQVGAVMLALGLIDANTAQTLSNKTIKLKQSTTPAPTEDGDIQWDTDDNVLVIGDGAGQKIFVALPAGVAAGDLLYLSAAKVLSRIAKGTAGQLFAMNSGATAPEWQSDQRIGVGQTWQTPTRSAGTTYQNTTGRPIMVAISGYKTAANYGMSEVSPDGTTWQSVCNLVGDSSGRPFSFIVPIGFYYRVESGTVVNTWRELR